jgi:hypothetical protein
MVNVVLCIVTFFHTIVIILVHLIYIHTSKTLGTNMSHAIFSHLSTRICDSRIPVATYGHIS